jgi:hypothetical protein
MLKQAVRLSLYYTLCPVFAIAHILADRAHRHAVLLTDISPEHADLIVGPELTADMAAPVQIG